MKKYIKSILFFFFFAPLVVQGAESYQDSDLRYWTDMTLSLTIASTANAGISKYASQKSQPFYYAALTASGILATCLSGEGTTGKTLGLWLIITGTVAGSKSAAKWCLPEHQTIKSLWSKIPQKKIKQNPFNEIVT